MTACAENVTAHANNVTARAENLTARAENQTARAENLTARAGQSRVSRRYVAACGRAASAPRRSTLLAS
jgi:hypothetical protein